MDKIKTIEGDLAVRDARFAIVAARFNDFIVESLLKAAVRCLRQHGAVDADIEIVRVPGAFEMPLMVEKLAGLRRFDHQRQSDLGGEAFDGLPVARRDVPGAG